MGEVVPTPCASCRWSDTGNGTPILRCGWRADDAPHWVVSRYADLARMQMSKMWTADAIRCDAWRQA